MAFYEIVEGWTAPVDITLLSKGIAPTGTMVGMSAELLIQDTDGNAIPTTGDVTIPNTSFWVVRYTPDATDLIEGTYRMRVKVSDGTAISFFPNGYWDILKVRTAV